MRAGIVTVWLALCHAALAAQAAHTGATLNGAVTDQHGAVVVGAEVRALNIASGRTLAARTDADGRYELTGLAPGPYQLSVSAAGFTAAARRVRVGRAPDPSREDFVLVPGIVESSVTVTAGKGSARAVAETPQSVTVSDAARGGPPRRFRPSSRRRTSRPSSPTPRSNARACATSPRTAS